MNILIASQYYYPENFRINDIAEELVARGHQVQVLTGLPDYATSFVPKEYKWRKKRNEFVKGVTIHRVPIIARRHGVFFRFLNYLSYAFSSWLYAGFCKKPIADVVFVYQTSPIFQAIPALKYRKRLKIPVVLYCCDLWPESLKAGGIAEPGLIFSVIKRISSKIYRGCDKICVTSTPFIKYLDEVCSVSKEKMTYLPQHAEDLYTEIVGQYEQNDRIDFLFAGNIGKVQSIDCILKSAARIQKDMSFCIHIVGDGSELTNCKKLAQELDLKDKVIFYGRYPLEKMKDFYKMADCFLLTLRAEDAIGDTVPSKFQSYLSAGKPIIAAAGKGVSEAIQAADCGAAVASGDIDALAKIMEDVILHFEHYREKGIKGYEFYKANYSKPVFIERLTEILENQIKRGEI